MTGTILEQIVETKRREIAAAKASVSFASQETAAGKAEPARNFYDSVTLPGRTALIAEIKKKSPSAGLIREPFDPVAIAQIYETNGAAALSVLTDRSYFAGDLSFIDAVKRKSSLPVLRKDFILEEYQVFESRAAGADAILLIAEILSGEKLQPLAELSQQLGMATLIEIHDPANLPRVLPLISPDARTLLGINNRDLHAQRTTLMTSFSLARQLPQGVRFVAESGIQSRADVQALSVAGACAILVGETLMRADDIGAMVRELLGGA
ncbi:MAG: hypothetical protein B6D36_16200 [Planctomycetes bacterium UTPLA1]|jgi:indole-3-glycerol phosphate synthase|nr:MAG: hypothetical protein B6D36_16200 [Planctomycetes bacterium UTPLA1]